jgi:DNA-binding response OmpR family regulator
MSVENLFEVLDVPPAVRPPWQSRGMREGHKRRRSIYKGTVLFIDDDPLEWARGADHLARRGFWVTRIEGSSTAPEFVGRTRPDVVILEIAVHATDGLSLLRSIRCANPSLPIVIYSRTPRYRDDFTSWLADDYLLKSDDVAPLCDTVEALFLATKGSGETHATVDR